MCAVWPLTDAHIARGTISPVCRSQQSTERMDERTNNAATSYSVELNRLHQNDTDWLKMKLHIWQQWSGSMGTTAVKIDNGTNEWQLAKVNNDLSENLLCNSRMRTRNI